MAMSLTKPSSSILEVGFNSGHSASMFLSLFPLITVTSFDLCQHVYTAPAMDKLVEVFGEGRLKLHCGNSHITMREVRKEFEGEGGEGGKVEDKVER